MSIIEKTLRNQQKTKENEGYPERQVVEKEAPSNTIPARNRVFVVIAIVLSLLGLGVYFGLEKYQQSLFHKRENLDYQLTPLVPLENPADLSQNEVPSHEDRGVIASSVETKVSAVDKDLKVAPNKKTSLATQKTAKSGINENAITGQTSGPPLTDNKNVETSRNETSENGLFSPGTVLAVKSDHDIRISQASQETKSKQEFDSSEISDPVHPSQNRELSSELAEDTTHLEEKPPSSLLEEYVVGKHLRRARHLINIGSYAEAIDILKPIIDRQEEMWDAYLLMGAAHLGTGELDYAETYLEMGLAIDGNVPQLWLQCAIVEQQRGEHEVALRILNETEKLSPNIPEVQLNIGYSNDAIGNQKLAVQAYNSFLQLTEGNPDYLMVRFKVLQRLHNLK
ncbi:MAG: tetratricopeptide repeat protein [Planctomycetes bacterium]|nr:tetratricopeptide repeat protein [Planctomycetota bacterium]